MIVKSQNLLFNHMFGLVVYDDKNINSRMAMQNLMKYVMDTLYDGWYCYKKLTRLNDSGNKAKFGLIGPLHHSMSLPDRVTIALIV